MYLQIDEHAAAYGLFHLAFANLDTRVSRSVVDLLRCGNKKLAFDVVKRMPFSRRLQILQRAVKRAVDNELHDAEVDELKEACKVAEDVARWRNERIHGEVKFINDNQPVLLDEQGEPLRISYETCREKIGEAVRARIAMEATVPHLVAWEMDLDDLTDESS
jgi:hypothetical protein